MLCQLSYGISFFKSITKVTGNMENKKDNWPCVVGSLKPPDLFHRWRMRGDVHFGWNCSWSILMALTVKRASQK
jgi:hypothetical protein